MAINKRTYEKGDRINETRDKNDEGDTSKRSIRRGEDEKTRRRKRQ
jgi:hypothetical protein